MRDDGQKRKIVTRKEADECKSGDEDTDCSFLESQILVTESEMKQWVRGVSSTIVECPAAVAHLSRSTSIVEAKSFPGITTMFSCQNYSLSSLVFGMGLLRTTLEMFVMKLMPLLKPA